MALTRVFRISLRRAIVLMTLACLGLALYAEHARRQRIVAFVDGVISPSRFHGGMMDTSSPISNKAARLTRYDDRKGTVRELFRRLNDPRTSGDGDVVMLHALGGMTETPGVVTGLLALMEAPLRERQRSSVIYALQFSEVDAELVVERIIPFTRNEELKLRRGAYYTLEMLGYRQRRLQPLIAPALIAGMSDPNESIRERCAGAAGIVGPEKAVPVLTRLLDDPNGSVRVMAARAFWKITRNRDPLLQAATGILREDDNLEAKKDAAYAVRDVGGLPAETQDALRAHADFPGRPPFNNKADVLRFQLASIAADLLKAQAAESGPF